MKTIVAGSRNLVVEHDIAWVRSWMASVLVTHEITEVVSGDAWGPDRIGAAWARLQGIPVKHFPVTNEDWVRGLQAGYLRNAVMADYADKALIFWDHRSTGTKHMIELMVDAGKPYEVYSP